MSEPSFYATGRRKRAVARVYLVRGQKGFTVNGQNVADYLKRANLTMLAESPLKAAQVQEQFRVRADVVGGGLAGQAGALSLGIARALVRFDEKLHSLMRQGGFLTRDPREKERKKFGRKGARKRFQYTKR